MKLILHIGTEKTGTTSLQEFLYSNISALSGCGVYLSKSLGGINNRKISGFVAMQDGGYWATRGISNLKQKHEHFRGFTKAFREEVSLAKEHHDHFIITCENIWRCVRTDQEFTALKKLLDGLFDEIIVTGYFRNPDDHFNSMYSTYARTSGTLGASDYYALNKNVFLDKFYTYAAGAEMWRKHFGRNNLKFFIFAKGALQNQDIRHDFLAQHFPTISDKFCFRSELSNTKMSITILEIMLAINHVFPRYESSGVARSNEILKKSLIEFNKNRCAEPPKNEVSTTILNLTKRYEGELRTFIDSYIEGNQGQTLLTSSNRARNNEIQENIELREAIIAVLHTLLDFYPKESED
jgi:hypothetical protein